MKRNIEVKLLEKESVPIGKLVYVVIGARFEGKWIFVRHRDRMTWEMPAGHIEPGETPDEAAERELFEETGAYNAKLDYLLDYSVTVNNRAEFGRLYFAGVPDTPDLQEFEIAEIGFADALPGSLTYPEVQTILFNEVLHYQTQKQKDIL